MVGNEEECAKSWQGEKSALRWSFKNLDKTAAGCLPQGCCFSLTPSWDRKDISQAAMGHFRPVRADNLQWFVPLFLFFHDRSPDAPNPTSDTRLQHLKSIISYLYPNPTRKGTYPGAQQLCLITISGASSLHCVPVKLGFVFN